MLRGSQGGRLAPGPQQSSTHQAEVRLRSGPPIWGTLGVGGAGDVGCGAGRGEAGRGGAGRGEAAVAIRCEVAQALRRCSRRSTSMESVARRKAE
jgi:hypothetical protein